MQQVLHLSQVYILSCFRGFPLTVYHANAKCAQKQFDGNTAVMKVEMTPTTCHSSLSVEHNILNNIHTQLHMAEYMGQQQHK